MAKPTFQQLSIAISRRKDGRQDINIGSFDGNASKAADPNMYLETTADEILIEIGLQCNVQVDRNEE